LAVDDDRRGHSGAGVAVGRDPRPRVALEPGERDAVGGADPGADGQALDTGELEQGERGTVGEHGRALHADLASLVPGIAAALFPGARAPSSRGRRSVPRAGGVQPIRVVAAWSPAWEFLSRSACSFMAAPRRRWQP